MRSLACLAFLSSLAVHSSLALAGPVHGAAAAAQLQQKRLEAGKAALDRLRHDARRRKYRDGWEAIGRDLDAAVRAAPTTSLAPEVALWAARARAELYEASRSPSDVRTAVLAYRKVDETWPDAPQGLEALTAAIRLGTRAHEHAETAAVARRLAARYPRSTEAKAALALLPAPPKAVAAAPGKPQRPVVVEDDADSDDGTAPATAAAEAPARSEVDVPREAVNVIEQMVQEARGGKPSPVGATQVAAPAPRAARPDDASAAAVAASPGARSRSASADAGAAAVAPSGATSAAVSSLGAHALSGAAAGSDDEGSDSPAAQVGASETAAVARPSPEAPPEPEAPAQPPQRTPTLVKLARDAVAKLTEPEDEPDAAERARELRATALSGGNSLAAQLGLKVRRVVIDPGHGGKDTGAIGPHGVREKDVALSIARRLATRLRVLGFTVVLTRKDDSFVALDERTRIANDAKADLFVSIHCNAARKRTLSGIETWTLNVASDRYAARLSAFENAEDERTVSDLRLILADLATKANAGDARELAQSVQSALVRGLRSRIGKVTDHGVKQALFYVLLGTHMPSILVETAFLSNPAEEARLRSAKYQDGAAEAIARGLKEFVDGRQRLALAP